MLLVASAVHNVNWNILFRRTFGPEETFAWAEQRHALPSSLSDASDVVSWYLTPSGLFSVGSAYRAICRSPTLTWSTPLWKAPPALKVKIFVWQLLRDRDPSGTEVAKRHGPGVGLCTL